MYSHAFFTMCIHHFIHTCLVFGHSFVILQVSKQDAHLSSFPRDNLIGFFTNSTFSYLFKKDMTFYFLPREQHLFVLCFGIAHQSAMRKKFARVKYWDYVFHKI